MGEGAEMKDHGMNVIFDMDGVIFDTERVFLECCIPVAERLGLAGIEEVVRECVGMTDEETHKKLRTRYGDNAPLEEFDQEVLKSFMERYERSEIPVKEGVVALLEALKQKGAGIAIGSSTRTDIVKMELRDAGLIDYFDVIVGGNLVKASKPAPDVFLLAAEKLGADIRECIIIEDSFNGVRAAHASGATVFMVPDLLKPTEEIIALTDHVFDSLVDVQVWLEGELEDNE